MHSRRSHHDGARGRYRPPLTVGRPSLRWKDAASLALLTMVVAATTLTACSSTNDTSPTTTPPSSSSSSNSSSPSDATDPPRPPIPAAAYSDHTGITSTSVSVGNVSTLFDGLFKGAAVGTQAYADYVEFHRGHQRPQDDRGQQ